MRIDQETEAVKYLVILIDRHLKRDFQVAGISNKLRGLLQRFKIHKRKFKLDRISHSYEIRRKKNNVKALKCEKRIEQGSLDFLTATLNNSLPENLKTIT